MLAEDIHGYISYVYTRKDISSLPVPDAKFQAGKSDYLVLLIVTPVKVAKKIKAPHYILLLNLKSLVSRIV